MIITISGDLGSGKSTVAKALAEKFNLKHYSAGDFMRDMAKERGITLLELSKLAEKDPSIDKEIDERTKKLAATEDNFVIDSRIAFHFIPNAIKIHMKVDPEEAAKRVSQRGQAGEEKASIEETRKRLIERAKSEAERYKKYYGIDVNDESKYDLVFDTTHTKTQEGVDKILEWTEEYVKKTGA